MPHCPATVGWGRKSRPPAPQSSNPGAPTRQRQWRRLPPPFILGEGPWHFKGRVRRGFRALACPQVPGGWGAPALPRGPQSACPCTAPHHLPSPEAAATPKALGGQEGGLGKTRKRLGAWESHSSNVQVEPSVASERNRWKLLEGCQTHGQDCGRSRWEPGPAPGSVRLLAGRGTQGPFSGGQGLGLLAPVQTGGAVAVSQAGPSGLRTDDLAPGGPRCLEVVRHFRGAQFSWQGRAAGRSGDTEGEGGSWSRGEPGAPHPRPALESCGVSAGLPPSSRGLLLKIKPRRVVIATRTTATARGWQKLLQPRDSRPGGTPGARAGCSTEAALRWDRDP